jgi:type IV secretion system protein VirB6
MSGCQSFGVSGPGSIAEALQNVDCLSAEATSVSFGRLFGPNGSLTTALTVLLTLYVALFAFNLLAGRSTLRVSVLTPRMMTMGLIITFVTSWVAYQSVVWNLAIGAPDEIASALLGTKGSATILFAQRLDTLFTAVSNAANSMAGNAPSSAKLASPANILWVSSLMLLLGTVGVLVVCRIALAALLIIGPVFIVLALFEGTRGLFEGWLKSVAMFALVPLLTVVMGSGALMAIFPMIEGLGSGEADVSLRTAVSVLVASIVYLALMLLVLEVAATLTRGWSLTKGGSASPSDDSTARPTGDTVMVDMTRETSPSASLASDRVRTTIASLNAMVSTVSTSRVPTMSVVEVGAIERFPNAVARTSDVASGRHSLYFSHRTQSSSSPLSREEFR